MGLANSESKRWRNMFTEAQEAAVTGRRRFGFAQDCRAWPDTTEIRTLNRQNPSDGPEILETFRSQVSSNRDPSNNNGEQAAANGLQPKERLIANLQRRNIPGLDGIRGIVALSVVAFHGWSAKFPGRFAVQVFFVISGLLITWLLLQEERRSGTIDRYAFYVRRVFRLLPALLLLLVWEWVTDFPHVSRGQIIAAGSYFANYYAMFGDQPIGLAHTWSLAVEEHFYLIWPQLFLFVRNRKTLLIGCLISAVGEFSYRIFAAYHGAYLYAINATETSSSAVLFGCGLALLLWYFPKRLPAFVLEPFMLLIALAFVLALSQVSNYPQSIWVPLGIPFAGVIVLQAVAYEWRILENPVAHYLGRISYGIYLWGFVAIAAIKWLRHDLKHTLLFAAVIALASISHHLIERPVQSLGRRWLASRRLRVSGPALCGLAS